MSTNIEWTTETLNPTAGCDKISAGCKECYAIKEAHRLAGNPNEKIAAKYNGTTKSENGVLNWTGRINFSESALLKPLSIKKPTTFFVNSMSDLFHHNVKREWRDRFFAVAALTPQHTYQILTKRAAPMFEYFRPDLYDTRVNIAAWMKGAAKKYLHDEGQMLREFPLKNVWQGVSVENRKEKWRIDVLRRTNTAIRFLSLEPLLEDLGELDLTGIDWVIVGGESGNGARPCDISWIRSIVQQCKSGGTKVFVKQLGSLSVEDNFSGIFGGFQKIETKSKKGGDISEFPADLQIREMPV